MPRKLLTREQVDSATSVKRKIIIAVLVVGFPIYLVTALKMMPREVFDLYERLTSYFRYENL